MFYKVVFRSFQAKSIDMQRFLALFFLLLFLFGANTTTASAIAASLQDPKTNAIDNHKSTDPGATTKEHKFSYPAGLQPTKSTVKAAADTGAIDPVSQLTQKFKPKGEGLQGIVTKQKITPHELVDKRSASKSVSVNTDGTLTEKNYLVPHFYQNNGQWTTIDNTLTEDKNAGDSANPLGKALGQVESWVSSSTNYKSDKNNWQARFSPSNSPKGMVRVQKGNSQIGYVPVNANTVAPVITTDKDGTQTVHFYNLWQGVDVEYVVHADAVKENIVVKDKSATNEVSFKLVGGVLVKHAGDSTTAPYYAIKGALNDEFGLSPANLILNNFGPVTEKGAFSQTVQGDTIKVGIDEAYLQSLPDKAFPAVIDPSTFYSTFGTRDGGNYVSMKSSDIYICHSNECNPYAGTLYDSSNTLRYWRSAFYANYDTLKTPGNNLVSATLHLSQRNNAGFWTGNYNTHNYFVGHAVCLDHFACLENETWNASGAVSTSGDIDVKNIYDEMVRRGDFNAWLMLGTNDNATDTYKNFDPGTGAYDSGSYIAFSYGGPPSAPSIAVPTEGQVFVDPQPSFSVGYQTNPNGSTPLQYDFLVSSGVGATGALVDSGRQSSLQWTIPDGVLQDGSTYYLQVRSFDPITSAYSSWGVSTSFRVDMRTGKDKSQTYDTVGPVSVDLATGNLATSTSSHASAALGGSLGVGLDYNSPLKSRAGLVGKYWNVPANYSGGLPTSTPDVTRVDQNVDFGWDVGTPDPSIHTDWFYSSWDGYFVPQTTGTYYFGANMDDSMVIKINNQQLYSGGGCYTGICYGSSITLTAGQAVKIHAEYQEATGPAYAHMYVKTPDGVDQVVQQNWLQTGVRPVNDQHGLKGEYYANQDGTNTFSANNPLFLKRVDPYLSFNWGSGAPVAGGAIDTLVRWTGVITVPVAGTYTFGARSDDGTRIVLGGTTVLDDWTNHGVPASPTWGTTNYTFNSNTVQIPITIEYYDTGGPGSFEFWAKTSDGVTIPQQIVPTSWMLTKAQTLPAGWKLGLNVSGNVSYDHLTASPTGAVLSDSSGSTHEYKWSGTSYIPPVNEDGYLIRNSDGSFTLQDTNGMTYVFDKDGTLIKASNAVDDRNPAALQYTYGSINGGPVGLTKISDGVDTSRTASLYYYGDSNCDTVPGGFDIASSTFAANMLCAVKTSDGRVTDFFYNQGQLARIVKPGGESTDLRYEAVTNDSAATIGYRMNGIRDSLAMDTIAATMRADDDTTNTSITYDSLGRVLNVTLPAPTAGAARLTHSIEYLPGAKSYVDQFGNTFPGYTGMVKLHTVNASEPSGFSRRIKFDNLYRTIENTDNTNHSATTEWDPNQDLIYSATDQAGYKTTTTYDDENRSISSYGPAPTSWFDTSNPKNQIPLSSYASQVPRLDAGYDESIVGPSVAWFDYTKQTSNTSGVLYGAPKLHTTGINTATPGTLSYNFTTPPISASTVAQVPAIQGIGLSATGKLRVPTGTYTFSAAAPDGVRLWVDDQLLIDQWTDSSTVRTTTSASFTVSSTAPKRVRLDIYRKTGTTGSFSITIQQQGGFAATNDWSSYLKPDYSLLTSAKAYDSTLGNSTATVNYGANPELGLAQSSTVDPTGLNLSTTNAFEQQGAANSYNRQTSKKLPGSTAANPSSIYAYYGSTATRQNPCDTTKTYKQAGMLNSETGASPNGGTTPGVTTENVYDDAGRVVASRSNNDAWTCTTYDSRGRVVTISIPSYNGEAARTVNNDYAVSGNPLESSSWDGNGWIVKWTDLLGRMTKYRDVHDDETTTTYDNFGNVTQKVSPVGTVTYTYDEYYRLSTQSLDGITYATVVYDPFSRVNYINYNNVPGMKQTIGRDSLGRNSSIAYNLSTAGSGTVSISDTVTRTQSGRVQADVVQSGSNNLYQTYGYDAAGRLNSANIGPNTYAYGYGTQSSTCGSGSNMNANAGKNGNRTTQTVNGTTTSYCYDYADRLVSSSDPTANYAEYDSHGNMTYLGTGTTPLRLCYDSSDRNTCMVNYDSNQTGSGSYYGLDVSGRMVYRERDTITAGSWSPTSVERYGYTGDGDSPAFVRDGNGAMVEKNIQLPGGVTVSVKPQQTNKNIRQYSLPSALGHTLMTANAAGEVTGTGNGPAGSFTYDPYGNIITGSTRPANATDASYGFGGTRARLTETNLALAPIRMGSRVYLPTLGRFTQIDPVSGGTANNYVYALDPINSSDYSGNCIQCAAGVTFLQPTITVVKIQPAAGAVRIQSAVIITTLFRTAAPVARAVAKQQDNSTMMPIASVTAYNITNIKAIPPNYVSVPAEGPKSTFNPASLLPPGGYSFKGAITAVAGGCAITSGAFVTAAAVIAPFTDGLSIPIAGYEGCVKGATGGFVTYIVTGDGNFQDSSVTEDVRGYLSKVLY